MKWQETISLDEVRQMLKGHRKKAWWKLPWKPSGKAREDRWREDEVGAEKVKRQPHAEIMWLEEHGEGV